MAATSSVSPIRGFLIYRAMYRATRPASLRLFFQDFLFPLFKIDFLALPTQIYCYLLDIPKLSTLCISLPASIPKNRLHTITL